MALLVCEDCGHKVSDLAFTCPKCGRPTSSSTTRASDRGNPSADPDALAPGTATQPVIQEAWLGDLKKARELPVGVKRCMRCDADVAVDAFRKKNGDGYLCSDCLDEDDDRRRVRGELFTRLLVTIGILLVAGAFTAGAIRVLPLLQSSKGVKTAK